MVILVTILMFSLPGRGRLDYYSVSQLLLELSWLVLRVYFSVFLC